MKTVVKIFKYDKDDDEVLVGEYEDVIVPQIDSTIFIDEFPCIVENVTYDYSDCINKDGRIVIEVITQKMRR